MKHGPIAVIGSRGQLGKALVEEVKYLNPRPLIGLDVLDGFDAANYEMIEGRLGKFPKPRCVINCAAATNVDRCEVDWEYADAANVQVPKNLARWCADNNVYFAHVSTDYVFSGQQAEEKRPYEPDDETDPLNIYGKTKRLGEEIVQQISPKNLIVRTSGLFGDGKNFVRTILKKAKECEPLSVVCDEVFRPTYACDLARMLVMMISHEMSGLYHVTNDGLVTTWYNLAECVLQKARLTVRIEPITAEEWRRKGVDEGRTIPLRPPWSVLSLEALEKKGFGMPLWHDALDRYLPTLKN